MRKEHPKKQRSGTVVAKATCRKWKKDPASCPVLTATAVAKSRSDRMKSMYGKKRGYKKYGRTLVEVPVDWSCWSVQNQSARKKSYFVDLHGMLSVPSWVLQKQDPTPW